MTDYTPPDILEACGLSPAGAPAIVRAAAQAVALAQLLRGDAGHVRIWPVCWYMGRWGKKNQDIAHPTRPRMLVRYQEALDAWVDLLACELGIPCETFTSKAKHIIEADWHASHKVTTSMQLYAYDEEHPRGRWRTPRIQVPGDLSEAYAAWRETCDPTIERLRRAWNI